MKKIIVLCLALFLTACGGIAVPSEKSDYVGLWSNADKSITLNLYQSGRVEYESKGAVNKSISAPLLSFEEEDFLAGLGFIKTKFDITKAPYEEDGTWKMELDGEVLIRE